MSFTVVLMPMGSTTTCWPLRTMPLAICPLKPRKSCSVLSVGSFGRLTHCTGKRNELMFQSLAMWTFSRWRSSVGPSYHGVNCEASTTLSPFNALMGMNFTSRKTSSFGQFIKDLNQFFADEKVLAVIDHSRGTAGGGTVFVQSGGSYKTGETTTVPQ